MQTLTVLGWMQQVNAEFIELPSLGFWGENPTCNG